LFRDDGREPLRDDVVARFGEVVFVEEQRGGGGRGCCWPTNRRVNWTRRRAARLPRFSIA
jgi:hypothetical protein